MRVSRPRAIGLACGLALAGLLVSPTGCAPGVGLFTGRSPVAPGDNQVILRGQSPDQAWENVVDVLHEYHFEFSPGSENRLAGILTTDYRIGANLLEPWHKDSVGLPNRLESTFQTIRRRVIANFQPIPGGTAVTFETVKEIEDLRGGLAARSRGAATFRVSDPLVRDLNLVVGQTDPSGWIPLGRDVPLEQSIVANLRSKF